MVATKTMITTSEEQQSVWQIFKCVIQTSFRASSFFPHESYFNFIFRLFIYFYFFAFGGLRFRRVTRTECKGQQTPGVIYSLPGDGLRRKDYLLVHIGDHHAYIDPYHWQFSQMMALLFASVFSLLFYKTGDWYSSYRVSHISWIVDWKIDCLKERVVTKKCWFVVVILCARARIRS